METEKTAEWARLPFYVKIRLYKKHITAAYGKYVDKLSAKEVVSNLCSDIKIPKVIKVLKSPADLLTEDLSTSNIIKAAHASGWNTNITRDSILSDIKKRLDFYYRPYNTDEQQYKDLKPTFFIEEKVNDYMFGITGDAVTFMIRCIRGVPCSVGVKYLNMQNIYDASWILLEKPQLKIRLPDIRVRENMLKYAGILSAQFEFVRIDFYVSKDGNIYFSEFTFTPANGNKVFSMATELKLGALWR
jgi:hypothetical protein